MEIKIKNEYKLVHAYLVGDKLAGDKLYVPILPLLEKYVYSKTKNSVLSYQDKEDIISNTLKKSIEILDRFTGKSSFSTYVLGIANNIIMQAYDRYKISSKNLSVESIVETGTELEVFSSVDLSKPGQNPPDTVIRKESINFLNKAFSMLTPEYQQIIQMRLFNKVSVKQVASITGKTEDSIDALYRRALKKYKEIFIQLYK